jgi:hypothetical protein
MTGRTTLAARAGGVALLAREHVLFLVALFAGIALRLVVMAAYHPAIIFFDSTGYLRDAVHPELGTLRPIGYSLTLWPILKLSHDAVGPIVVVQHLIGLALAVACYVFLLRRGLPRWAAALATLPLLLDPLQLVLEHYILSDVVFEGLLVAACLTLLWRTRPGFALLVASGLAVGASALVRGAGSFLLVVFLVAVLCLRLGWARTVAFAVAGLLPMVLYASAYHASHGEYALSKGGARFLYARLAPIVRCHDPQLTLPPYEKMLCPDNPVGQRATSNYFMWGGKRGPAYRLVPPAGMTREQVLGDFSKRVVRAQPTAFARTSVVDFLRGFEPSRTSEVKGFPARYWLFQRYYWMRAGAWHPTANSGPAGFLKTYRKTLWTPGPLLGGLLLVALVGAFGLGRARRCGDRVAIGLLAGACGLTLLTGAALSGPSWRYQLPQLPLIPLAAALAIAALVRGAAPGRADPLPPLRPLARVSAWLGSREPRLRRLDERGVLPLLVAVAAGLVSAVVVAVGAVGSGWFLPRLAGAIGLVAGLVVVALLVVSHRRTAGDVAQTPDEESEREMAGQV